jgi:hypothetical protein
MTHRSTSIVHALAVLAHAGSSSGGNAVGKRLIKSLFDPYRPELHYMRGPGPKWREKQARLRSARPDQARAA